MLHATMTAAIAMALVMARAKAMTKPKLEPMAKAHGSGGRVRKKLNLGCYQIYQCLL